MTAPRLAITIGDPAGIGPEIALKALGAVRPRIEAGEFSLLLVGDAKVLERASKIVGIACPEAVVSRDGVAEAPGAAILDIGNGEAIEIGKVSAVAGRQAFSAVEAATVLAQAGAVAAIVTGPLNKEALHLGGYLYAGHTEMLADLTGVSGSVMMLAHGNFRVSHVTTHCALADVPVKATSARIEQVVRLTQQALQRIGISEPRIAIAALNPHCGEGGIFGRHDIDVTEPLVARLREDGLGVTGPVPGDTVFVSMRGGKFDAVIAMYHDQGHIPVKLLGFDVDPATGEWSALNGVNITLGLPVIRTSVDHGTAFDIAGNGKADATSLVEAIDYALLLSKSR